MLLLIYNRLDTLQAVWEVLRQIKPRYLFVSGDGPRKTEVDYTRTQAVRHFVQSAIDWRCEASFHFFPENQGCKMAVAGGISWFFSQVEAGIILEDDTLPHPTFFTYATEMLERYATEVRVGGIGGTQLFPDSKLLATAWDFVRLPFIWGWATWRRVWQKYDPHLHDWAQLKAQGFPDTRFCDWRRNGAFMRMFIEKVVNGELDTWDAQLMTLFLRENLLFVIPAKNLVRNLGHGHPLAHHTRKRSWIGYLPLQAWEGGPAPLTLSPNLAYEKAFLERFWRAPLWRRAIDRLYAEVRALRALSVKATTAF